MPTDTPSTLLAELTVAERVSLLSGCDTWRTAPIDRIGLGSIKVTDGPNGARGDSTTGATAVCLPSSIALGASFDHDLVAEIGRLLGQETARKGSHVLLAPTVNLARHPQGGRNFESFGEDPLLTAALAVAYVTGVQSEGVAACGKHFVANDVEFARMTVSSEVDEGVLREVYLLPFEAIVAAGVDTLMASYPKLNGIHCTEHEWLLTTLLREEWGFDGLVMSDWGATHHRARPVLAGLDLEMPGPPTALGAALEEAVADGEVPEAVLDERAGRVLVLAERLRRFDPVAAAAGTGGPVADEPERSIDLDEDRALARRAAVEGTVLLGNDGILPLAADQAVALIGPNAVAPVIQGGGSAQVPAHRIVDPFDGLAEALGPDRVTLHPGCMAHRYLPPVPSERWDGDERPLRLDLFEDGELGGEPTETRSARTIAAFAHGGGDDHGPAAAGSQRWTGALPITETGSHSFAVQAVGRSRVYVDGELVVDNWTAPRPGDGFFQMASAEVVGEKQLTAGSTAEVVVEWSPATDMMLRGLRFGYLPPVDGDALLDEAVGAAATADVAVVVVGLNNEWETEGHDRPSFALPGRQDELVRRVAATNDRTVVVVNAGGPVDLPWFDDVAAVVVAWYPGQEGGHALADVLTGSAEPGGRLPMTWPRRVADTPFELPIPEPGPPRPGAELPYSEGLSIGYRSYIDRGVEPLAPFGFGLGYTTFELGSPLLVADGGGLSPAVALGPGEPVALTAPVTNTGSRDGKCVVQVYLDDADAHGDDGRPRRVFAGFASVRVASGETVEAKVIVPGRAFARWDDDGARWSEPGGRRRLHVGFSSRDLAKSVEVERPAR